MLIPLGEVAVVGQFFGNIPIKIGERIFPTNLVPLQMTDFNVILGLDWLAQFYASVQCQEKKIIIAVTMVREPGRGTEPHVKGYKRMISLSQISTRKHQVKRKKERIRKESPPTIVKKCTPLLYNPFTPKAH